MKRKPTPRSPWITIALMVSPLFLLAALIGTIMLSGRGPGSDYAAREARERRDRLAAVAETVTATGAGFRETVPGVVVLTLPAEEALTTTAVQAKELALTTRSRTGGIVRIETPAGQVLAEAP